MVVGYKKGLEVELAIDPYSCLEKDDMVEFLILSMHFLPNYKRSYSSLRLRPSHPNVNKTGNDITVLCKLCGCTFSQRFLIIKVPVTTY
jgi:hypothetical protein